MRPIWLGVGLTHSLPIPKLCKYVLGPSQKFMETQTEFFYLVLDWSVSVRNI